ncbi:hypothetical protein L3X38_017458 [Prunus dulcis]|uniref:Aminotransferase-like plant mobile domain-containing protein n=1 Tax=Prunus dulcis TaxID=3755 RepID=A0AAD4W958_PRUDU|nr:hypothetical protein L3X38_017458 [Prunus dulcis]
MARKLNLEISTEGKLTAFLAFFLSKFALPSKGSRIRPETFYMASLMARGIKVPIAPTVLGYIYHGLGETVPCSRGPGTSLAYFPVHYVIGWMARVVFRSDISMLYRPSAFDEQDGLTFMDDEKLSDDQFEMLVCPERAKVTKDVVLDNSNFEANSGLLNPPDDNSVAQELARSSPCGVNGISPLANNMSSLEGCKKINL